MKDSDPAGPETPWRRRERYRGTHPRRYEQKYKELDPERDPETIARVIASGKTPAGQHRPIMVEEILQCLDPRPGARGADVTLGYGGHSEAILERIQPDGELLALDVDARQLPRTEQRLKKIGYIEPQLIVRRSNYAGLANVLAGLGWDGGIDFLLADFGLSSMQIDNPERGFSYKHDGPLDMRMNPVSGVPASEWLARCKPDKLAKQLTDGGDEPHAPEIAAAISAAPQPVASTRQLRRLIESALPDHLGEEARKVSVSRVFQAIRIAVNGEFSAIDAFLQQLPFCLKPGGRVAILSFHSGEDRRVKHHFRDSARAGIYSQISTEVVRASPSEIGGNPRAAPAKLRWAVRAS